MSLYLLYMFSYVCQNAMLVVCHKSHAFYHRKTCLDNEISGNIVSPTINISMEQCAMKCMISSKYDSFFYNSLTGKCGPISLANNGLSFTQIENGAMYFHSNANCCDEGWTYFRGSCYQIQTTSKNWAQSKIKCKGYGGFVAEPYREEINQFFISEKAKIGLSASMWIGGSDAAKEGKWVWLTSGQGFTYTNWRPGEPSNIRGHQDCITHNADGSWGDLGCDNLLYSVCQKDIKS